jgi:hypothetical protein
MQFPIILLALLALTTASPESRGARAPAPPYYEVAPTGAVLIDDPSLVMTGDDTGTILKSEFSSLVLIMGKIWKRKQKKKS